jgi:hypothetical protein
MYFFGGGVDSLVWRFWNDCGLNVEYGWTVQVGGRSFVMLCWCRVDFRYFGGSVMGWMGGICLSWGGWG